jgi:nitrite reductase (NADH) small subunit
MPDKIRIAATGDVPPGTGVEVTVGERVIALFNVAGKFYAIDGICPHAGGPLAEGLLGGTVVTCPWHGWQFDVSTGQHCLNPRLGQGKFAVYVEGDDVLVELPSE